MHSYADAFCARSSAKHQAQLRTIPRGQSHKGGSWEVVSATLHTDLVHNLAHNYVLIKPSSSMTCRVRDKDTGEQQCTLCFRGIERWCRGFLNVHLWNQFKEVAVHVQADGCLLSYLEGDTLTLTSSARAWRSRASCVV
jgi:hypothetical protein